MESQQSAAWTYDVEKEIGSLLASNYPQKEWIAEMRRKGSYLPPPENG